MIAAIATPASVKKTTTRTSAVFVEPFCCVWAAGADASVASGLNEVSSVPSSVSSISGTGVAVGAAGAGMPLQVQCW